MSLFANDTKALAVEDFQCNSIVENREGGVQANRRNHFCQRKHRLFHWFFEGDCGVKRKDIQGGLLSSEKSGKRPMISFLPKTD